MAITNGYATLAEVKNLLQVTVATFDADLERAVEAASRAIDDYTGRFFFTVASSARQYRADTPFKVYTDDFHTDPPTVKLDADRDGTFEVTVDPSEFLVEPLVPAEGRPQNLIRLVNGRFFPLGRRPGVEVTATWGWAAVPKPVNQTCVLLAAELWKRKDAPFGVAGFDELGVVRVGASDLRVLQRVNAYRQLPVA